jgi:hypothetical protein
MTLLEVLLALVLLLGMLASVFSLHRHAKVFRDDVAEAATSTTHQSGVMRRITDDLRAAMIYPLPGFDEETGEPAYVDTGLVGEYDRGRFVKARLPGSAAWALEQIGDQPIPAEPDVEQVRWAIRYDEETGEALGLERTSKRVLGWAAQESVGHQTVLVSSDIRMLVLRYFNGSEWQLYWDGKDLPPAVEIWISPTPLPEDFEPGEDILDFLETTPDVYRRIVYLPGGTRAMRSSYAPGSNAPGGANVGGGRVGGGNVGGGSVGGGNRPGGAR